VNGVILCQATDGVVHHFVPDPLGSVVMVRDAAGNTVYEAEYSPYGQVQSETGTNPSSLGFVGTLGYITDSVSSLYVRARYLLPGLGRWLTKDPLWPNEPGYSYVNTTPLADPRRLQPWPPPVRPDPSLPGKQGPPSILPLIICIIELIDKMLGPPDEHFDPPAPQVRDRGEGGCSDDEYIRRQRAVNKACKRGGSQRRFDCNLKKDRKSGNACNVELNRCIKSREAVCDCFIGGCNEDHRDHIEMLKGQRFIGWFRTNS
jgi:RHS repeat-associated protein